MAVTADMYADASIDADPDSPAGLWWVMRPALESYYLWPRANGTIKRFSANLPRPGSFPTVTNVSSGVALAQSANERNALRRILESLGSPTPHHDAVRPSDLARALAARSTARVRTVERWGSKHLERLGRTDVIPAWHARLMQALVAEQTTKHLGIEESAFLLVSIYGSPPSRVALRAAHLAGIPTVFVPHAPLTRLIQRLDMPVRLAIMRGPAEKSYLTSRGISSDGVQIAGHPGLDVLGARGALPSLEGPRVLALSPDPPHVLERIIKLVSDSGVGDHVVAPHPASDMSGLERMLPSGWTLHRSGRTVDLLKAGAAYVIQYSSGVALESALLGIPTADVRLDDRIPDYPFLDDMSVYPAIISPADVVAFAKSSTDRDRLRTGAMEWISRDGMAAAERAAALIRRAASFPSLIHDGWAAGGKARTSSPIQ